MQTTNAVITALRLSRAMTERLSLGNRPSQADLDLVDSALRDALSDVDAAHIIPSRSTARE